MRLLVLVLFALLPLQWFGVAATPLGQGRLHEIAMLGFAFVVLMRYGLATYAPVLRTTRVFVIANLYMITAIAAVAAYRGSAPTAALRQLIYLLIFMAVAGFFYRVASGREPRVLGSLRFVAAVTCLSLLVGFSVAMIVNGVNPAAVFAKSIADADPEIFQKEVFKSAFAGFGLDEEAVKGNLRHEIFGCVLLSMLVSTWAMRVGGSPTPGQVFAYRAAMALGLVWMTISLSRSILIAAAFWPLLAILRSSRRAELTTRQVGILFGFAAATGVVLVSGLSAVLVNRFVADTTGYEARAENYGGAFAAIPDHWLVGGFQTVGVSSHNFVVDTLLRDGVFAAVPAAAIVLTLLIVFGLMAMRLHRLSPALVPVVAALALPLVRAVTSGGGLIPPVEWVALGFVGGVLAAWRLSIRIAAPAKQDRSLVGAGV